MRADLPHRSFMRLMKTGAHRWIDGPDGRILLSGPGRGTSRLKKSLRQDLKQANEINIMTPYFLPTYRLRLFLVRRARKGVKVRIMLPGKNDVRLSQLASRRLYEGLLKSGVEIYEYQPQVLHAKIIMIDDAVYIGSANLDTRSLYINYELSVRLENKEIAAGAREVFEEAMQHSTKIHLKTWRRSRDLLDRVQESAAYWLLARLDLYLARRQIMDLR
jgi:cardiolipin synthase